MKKIIIFLLIILILTVSVAGYYLVFKDNIEIGLNGELEYTLNVGDTNFKDDGIYLKNNKKIIENNKYYVKRDGNIDFNKIGNYYINYTVTYRNKIYSISRKVNVIDNIPPTLDINLEEINIDYCSKKSTKELIYTANDNYDGDITDKIELIKENNKYIFKVEDSSHNTIEKEINVNYLDKPKNVFKINGNNKIYVPLNGIYNENGVKYTDGCGNKLDGVNIRGVVNTKEVGTYKITYEVNGEKNLIREVSVYDPSVSKPTGSKVIYLTFDDGPGYYTNKILGILDKYNVKATFFVTHQFPTYIHLIKDEYDKGHSIAVHTYTHKYNIYTSVDTYLDDFNKMNDVIKTYTGSYTKLLRFPGGSSNTVSKSYNKGIMTELAKRMTDDGYIYFDWNVSSGDASANPTTNKIINNTINGVKNCTHCVILMHDIKSQTANALETIITSFIESGYTFAPLNETTPTAHHSINN